MEKIVFVLFLYNPDPFTPITITPKYCGANIELQKNTAEGKRFTQMHKEADIPFSL